MNTLREGDGVKEIGVSLLPQILAATRGTICHAAIYTELEGTIRAILENENADISGAALALFGVYSANDQDQTIYGLVERRVESTAAHLTPQGITMLYNELKLLGRSKELINNLI